jgi:hypothetical protein
MTTLAVGQLVTQGDTGRIWRLTSVVTSNVSVSGERWTLELIEFEHRQRGESRMTGDRTTASPEWLQRCCTDWALPTIDPPCGDGIQAVSIIDATGTVIDSSVFETADEMLAWVTAAFEAHDDPAPLVGNWYGWDTVTGDPDMTVTFDDDGLVWAEA